MYSLSQRAVIYWNRLSADFVSTSSVDMAKNRIDKQANHTISGQRVLGWRQIRPSYNAELTETNIQE